MLAEEAYTITQINDAQVEVSITGVATADVMAAIHTACDGKTIRQFRVEEGAVLNCGITVVGAETVYNYGTVTGGSLEGSVLYNYGTVNGGQVYDVVNGAEGTFVSRTVRDEDGDKYTYYPYVYGTIENYGQMNAFRTGENTSVALNEGYIGASIYTNASWDWDDGWGWEMDYITAEYGARVEDALGEGWHTADGAYAGNLTLDFSQTLYQEWSKADGVLTVWAHSSGANVYLSSEILSDVTSIVVQMGRVRVDTTALPITLSHKQCEDGSHYYTSGLCGGTYNGVITVERTAEITGCTINGTLALNNHCKVTNTTFGSGAQTLVQAALPDSVNNIWKPSGFPYTYDMDLTVTESGSIQCTSGFNGTVTNNGSIANGYYYGDVINYGSVTGGTFYGALRDYSPHAHAADAASGEQSWTRWDGFTRLTLSSGDNYIALAGDVSYASVISVASGQTLHLCLDGFDLISSASTNAILVNGGVLTVCDCTGNKGSITHASGVDGCGVAVNGGSFTLYSGRIAGHTSGSDGAGVRVYGNGTFTMHGGVISGNAAGSASYGGGVLCDGATFHMYGGSITGNTAARGGGVRVSSAGHMYLHGGSIASNTATELGGGVYFTACFDMDGGSITGNTALAGGAVYNNGSYPAVISGGSITGNSGTNLVGGLNGPVTLSGDAVITGNTAAGKACNLSAPDLMITLGSFTGSAGVSPAVPAANGTTVFLRKENGSVTWDELSRFTLDFTGYGLHIDDNGQGVAAHKTYPVTLVNALFPDGTSGEAAIIRGAEVTAAAHIPEDKIFTGWKRSDGKIIESTALTYTFTAPLYALTVTAECRDIFEIENGVLVAYHGTAAGITLPSAVTEIAGGVFANHPELETVFIPDGVAVIGAGTFDPDVLIRSSVSAYARTWAEQNGYTWEHDEHKETVLEAVAVTCTTDGLTEGLWCPECEVVFTAQEVIPHAGHTTVFDPEVPATCTKDGLTEGSHCSVCGEVFVAQEAIAAPGHAVVTDAYVAPTDRETGLTEGSHCSVCSEVLVAQQVIPANFDWDGDTITGYNRTDPIVTIPSDASGIGDDAFAGMSFITSVTVPENILIIGNGAFSGCTGLTRIDLPDGIGFVGEKAFDSHTLVYAAPGSRTAASLSWVDIPFVTEDGWKLLHGVDSASRLPVDTRVVGFLGSASELTVPAAFGGFPTTILLDRAFAGHSELTAISLPESLTTIWDNTFENCTGLASIVVPENVTSVGSGAFMGCTSLTSVSLPQGLTVLNASLFENCTKLAAFTVPSAVKRIDFKAFGGCSALRSIALPQGLEVIGGYAFAGCSRLPSIDLPAGVKEIGAYAFSHCSRLASVTLPSGLTELKEGVFEYCAVLTGINLPAGIKTIGAKAFYMCERLSKLVLPDGTVSLGDNALAGCSALTSVYLPQSVTALGSGVFAYCTSLAQVALPDGIAHVGTGLLSNSAVALYVTSTDTVTAATLAAAGYSYQPILTITRTQKADGTYTVTVTACADVISSVTVPEGVTHIGAQVFMNHSLLSEISLPSTLEDIGAHAFYGCEALKEVTIPGGVWMLENNLFSHCTSLERVVLEDGVGVIGKDVFYGCSALEEIVIPSSVYEIGQQAFRGCASLKAIAIPEGVEELFFGTFYGCTSLADVSLPQSLTVVGAMMFADCTSLTELTLPDGIASVESTSFGSVEKFWLDSLDCTTACTLGAINKYFCMPSAPGLLFLSTQEESGSVNCAVKSARLGVTELVVPEGVTAIESSAFAYDATPVVSITLPQSLQSIGSNAFQGCSALTGIVIPDGVNAIGQYAFNGCTSLSEVSLPKTLERISYETFDGCSSLTSVVIPETVKEIASWAFSNCSSLASIDLPENLESIGTFAFAYSGLTSVDIPGKISSVANSAFAYCDKLQSVTLPDGLITIGTNAFQNCTGLTAVTIPDTVTTIGQHAFTSCDLLTAVSLPGGIVSLDSYSFNTHITALIVPELDCATAETITALDKTYRVAAEPQLSISMTINEDGSKVFTAAKCDANAVEVTIPQGVERIGDSAFSNCRQLTSVVIPDSVTSMGNRAFDSCSALVSVSIPGSVAGIGTCAFAHCSSLVSAKLCEGVAAIGDQAFDNCSALTTITLPQSLRTIGSSAFYGCYALQTIYLPANITEIGSGSLTGTIILPELDCPTAYAVSSASYRYTLEGNEQLNFIAAMDGNGAKDIRLMEADWEITTAVVPHGVTSLGSNAFYERDQLISVTLPDSLHTICEGAFAGCDSLASIHIPESVTEIGEAAFRNCSALAQADGMEGLKVLKPNVFASSGLKTVTLSDTLEVISENAFKSCPALASIHIPDGVTEIGANAFQSCSALTTITGMKNVRTIGEYAFYYCALVDVELGSALETIASRAFGMNHSMRGVVIPDPLVSIASDSFVSGTPFSATETSTAAETLLAAGFRFWALGMSTESLSIQVELKNGERYRTAYCSDKTVTSVTVPEGVHCVSFANCTRLTSVTLPQSLRDIGSKAFEGCTALACVDLPTELTSVSSNAFPDSTVVRVADMECTTAVTVSKVGTYAVPGYENVMLQTTQDENGVYTVRLMGRKDSSSELIVPEGVHSFSSVSINNASGITSLVLPQSLHTLEPYALNSMTGLTSLVLPDGIRTVSDNNLTGKTTLYAHEASVTADTVITYGWHFRSLDEQIDPLYIVVLPDGNGGSGRKRTVYTSDKTITEAVIPEGVDAIGDQAFMECANLTSVTLPQSLSRIGYRAFYTCRNIGVIDLPANITYVGNEAFMAGPDPRLQSPDCATALAMNGMWHYVLPGYEDFDLRTDVNAQGEYRTTLIGVPSGDEVVLPPFVEDIAQGACFNKKIKRLVLNDGLASIPDLSGAISSAFVPDSVLVIDPGAFNGTTVIISSAEAYARIWAAENNHTWQHDRHIRFLPGPCTPATREDNGTVGAPICKDCGVSEGEARVITPSQVLFLPAALWYVDEEGFAGSAAWQITLPHGMETIASRAFANCANLLLVDVPATVTSIADDAFDGSSQVILLLNAYQTAIIEWAERNEISICLR